MVSEDWTSERCRRCGITKPSSVFTARSRVETDREVIVCSLCGALEGVRAMAGRLPVPVEDWPVDPGELGREFALYAKVHRGLEAKWDNVL